MTTDQMHINQRVGFLYDRSVRFGRIDAIAPDGTLTVSFDEGWERSPAPLTLQPRDIIVKEV